MIIARNSILAGVIVGLAALSACQSAGPGGPGDAAPDPVKGNWMSTDGVAVSSFGAGQFSSKFPQTGETITTGSYTYRDQRTIDLVYFSVKSQRRDQATCFVSASQLDCTNTSGVKFSLIRTA